MGTVNISGLEPGMVIAADVKDRAGRVLLGAGKEITDETHQVVQDVGSDRS